MNICAQRQSRGFVVVVVVVVVVVNLVCSLLYPCTPALYGCLFAKRRWRFTAGKDPQKQENPTRLRVQLNGGAVFFKCPRMCSNTPEDITHDKVCMAAGESRGGSK